jgi:hypothetical protein
MSRKYISQQTDSNFIYPNNDPKQYDVEIIHDINNNSVSGTVTNFTGTSVSVSAITFNFDFTWSKNNAEVFERVDGNLSILSIHMMASGQSYYKPWRCVNSLVSSNIDATYYSGNTSFTVDPSEVGLTLFTNGSYQFEIRFIGHRAIYPVCISYEVTGIVPTPTSTPTPTPTPTATMTGVTPTPTPVLYTSGATLNVTDTGWIKYTTSSGDTYFNCTTIGTQVLTDCLICSSIKEGIPFADLAVFTITNCGNSCSYIPGPTPTPTPTSDECSATEWKIDNSTRGIDCYWSGYNCSGALMGGTVGGYSIGYTGCVADSTLTYTGFPIVTVAGYC